jgi:hypothetical protein
MRSKILWDRIEPEDVFALPPVSLERKFEVDAGYLDGLRNLKNNQAYTEAIRYRILTYYEILERTPKKDDHFDRKVISVISYIRALKWCLNELPDLPKNRKKKHDEETE